MHDEYTFQLHEYPHGCFLCKPEAWRVVFEGLRVRVITGMGPLRTGYVMIAPKEHVQTVAQLDETTLYEFSLVRTILIDALAIEYGSGFTAYEHGKTGACAVDGPEESGYCFHAHRVFIPARSARLRDIRASFNNSLEIPTFNDISTLDDDPYVFFETGRDGMRSEAHAFRAPDPLASQFVRRFLAEELDLGRPVSWAVHFNIEEMVDTSIRLRSRMEGIVLQQQNLALNQLAHLSRAVEMNANITIDGLSGCGKSTTARYLAQLLAAPLVDTGFLFRNMAQQVMLDGRVSAEQCDAYVNSLSIDSPKPEADDNVLAIVVGDPAMRELHATVIRRHLRKQRPCVIVGRTSWQLADGNATNIILQSSPRTRRLRLAFDALLKDRPRQSTAEIANHLRQVDELDKIKLPPDDLVGLVVVSNECRRLDAVVQDCLNILARRT